MKSELYNEEEIYKIEDAISPIQLEPDDFYIVICYADDLNNGGREKLSEIISALGWNFSLNAKLIELQKDEQIAINQFLLSNQIRVVLTFGFTSKQLGLQIQSSKYQKLCFEHVQHIQADSIYELMKDKSKKIQLWNAIKEYKI